MDGYILLPDDGGRHHTSRCMLGALLLLVFVIDQKERAWKAITGAAFRRAPVSCLDLDSAGF